MEKKSGDATRLNIEVESIKAEIEAYKKALLESDGDNKGIKDRIQAILVNFETEYGKVSQFYKEILVGDESNNSIKKKVLDAATLIEEGKSKAEKYVQLISEEKVELESFYIKIFGDEDSSDEKIKNGLKEEIRFRLEKLDNFYSVQTTKYDTQFEQIEGLLPGATSAGLATAFSDMKDTFNVPIEKSTRMFYDSLALIITISIVAMIDSIGANGIQFVHYESVGQFASSLGWKLPVIGAAVWLAIFASKRRSEAQRLQQEYAHKETFAKSYNGFKKQIEDLKQDDKEMLKALMTKAVESISDNASKTLDGSHGDKTPLQELVETVVPSLEKIKKSVSN
jgi:hypothetical protein